MVNARGGLDDCFPGDIGYWLLAIDYSAPSLRRGAVRLPFLSRCVSFRWFLIDKMNAFGLWAFFGT
ncbi:MAG TPA: hypothetical protein VN939_10300, partial [Chthoniobacterales bacterium]|nr:hypothetical protein [Chthoniobacterales bacterium]